VTVLERAGIVETGWPCRGDTGGEPARGYASAGEGEVPFSNAYALIAVGDHDN
jgi:hypothetical protein